MLNVVPSLREGHVGSRRTNRPTFWKLARHLHPLFRYTVFR